MYGQMLRDVYYDGYNPMMPFQPSLHTGMRQQPYPFMQGMNGGGLPLNYNPYMNSQPIQNFHPVQDVNPYYFQSVQGVGQQNLYQQPVNVRPSQNLFHNPLNPVEYPTIKPQQQSPASIGNPYLNPYPKASFLAKQPSGVKTVLNSFKSQDGSLDINKMVDTAGQMINAVSQVSSVVKGLGGIFKA